MRNLVKFSARVTKVLIKEKAVKHGKGEDAYEETIRIGTVQMEFDGDSVDLEALRAFIGVEGAALGLADTQMNLGGDFADKVGNFLQEWQA